MSNKPLGLCELQLRAVYAVLVAGKTARFAERKLEAIFAGRRHCGELPFEAILRWESEGTLPNILREEKTGRYELLARGLPQLARLNVETCTVRSLERVRGIGPKTARFFVLWTRPGIRCAALDVHVLRWLGRQGHRVPKATPPAGRTYRRLEVTFLQEAERRGLSARELDSQIWDAAQQAQERPAKKGEPE